MLIVVGAIIFAEVTGQQPGESPGVRRQSVRGCPPFAALQNPARGTAQVRR